MSKYVVNIEGGGYLCTGSYVVQKQRYAIIGDKSHARIFKSVQAAENAVNRMMETRDNLYTRYKIVEL